MKELWGSSHISAGHAAYLETLYETFINNPEDLSEEWLDFFTNLPKHPNSNGEISHQEIVREFKNISRSNTEHKISIDERQGKVIRLIKSYRNRGHLKANLDPLGMMEHKTVEDLSIEFHGLSTSDLDEEFYTDTFTDATKLTLREIVRQLEASYCGNIAIECNHIFDSEERRWFQRKFESRLKDYSFREDEKINIYERLNSAEGLAKYLSAKYPGMKRFGIDGAEALVPLVESVIQNCGSLGANQLCFGMAHRGRLNLLVNVLGKLPSELFSAFNEDLELDGANTGDVKYHLGFSSNFDTPGGEVHVSLFNNPSHLEIVDPVVLGSVRARQDRINDIDRSQVVPVLLHGDASFSGQGVVMESLQMSQTRGFNVGGTIHIIVNNQIGFTTSNINDSRSTDYSSDVAKVIQAPIIHVNGDDPEMVINAAKIACKYRNKFKKDIVIDLFCYRRRGHNEADDPSATQPLMYKKISKHPSVVSQYENTLKDEGLLSEEKIKIIKKEYRKSLEGGKSVAKNLAKKPNDSLWFDWKPFMDVLWWPKVDTTFNKKKLNKLAKDICKTPNSFNLGSQASKVFEERLTMNNGEVRLNWGFAENMAYATLLDQGYPIRFSGQDIRRGTFSHRHAVVLNQEDGKGAMPLVEIASNANTTIDIYDSLLSEEAVLGFEYGYSATRPSGLVLWEAQFGDFVNGAQVVIDQFIVSAEHKWERLSGLVMLLPHGYEGQGPEHSSARLERFLQLCANENIQVCVPSTPSQIYHLLRLQTIRKMRRPLIIISPKSLLRNPQCVSSIENLTDGSFEYVIDDVHSNPKLIKKIILCSGKVYYDLAAKKEELKIKNTAILRIEQLYPFPYDTLEKIIKSYENAKQFIWCQEEPSNQGAWFSHRHRLQIVLDRINNTEIQLISRKASSAPAVGLNKLHNQQQEALVNEALTS